VKNNVVQYVRARNFWNDPHKLDKMQIIKYPFSPFLIYFCTSRTPLLRLFRFGATETRHKLFHFFPLHTERKLPNMQ